MLLGETIATYDVALALRGESGKFEVRSPSGEIYHVTCKPNHSISSLEWSGGQTGPQPFLVHKVAEPVPQEHGKAVAPGSAAQMRTGRAPFLPENQEAETRSASNGDRFRCCRRWLTMSPRIQQWETWTFFTWRVILGQSCRQPASVKNLQQNTHEWITSPRTTLNEFDAEIRRLHSQLDEIRYRARKKFYQATQAVAAGA